MSTRGWWIVVMMALANAAPAVAGQSCNTWQQIGSPNISRRGDNTFAAVAGRATDDVWAVGQYGPDSNPNITLTFAAHYDGRSWTYIPTPNVGREANALHSLSVTRSGRVWAVGYYIDNHTFHSRTLIELWDGAQWQIVSHPDDPGVSAVFFGLSGDSPNDIWAVGEYQQPLDRFHTLIEHFDGSQWSIVPSPDPGTTGDILYGVVARDRNAAWAVGEKHSVGPLDRALILGWDGEKWLPFPAPRDEPESTRLYVIGADSSGALHAAGEAEDDMKRTVGLSEIAVSGRPWSIQHGVSVGQSDNHFYSIAAAPGGAQWAVGAWFDPKNGRQYTLTERARAGEPWQVLTSPSPSHSGDSLLGGVTVVGNDVWAVGAYDGPQAQRSLILHTCR